MRMLEMSVGRTVAIVILLGVTGYLASPVHQLNVATKKATFGLGCFWRVEALFGAAKGVVRTKVGYSGGKAAKATYKEIGDHTEVVEIDYNPTEVTYKTLINIFWENHHPSIRYVTQYQSMVLYRDNEEKAIAEKTMKEQEEKAGSIVTVIRQFVEFFDAEDYHQKYMLQHFSRVMNATGLRKGPILKNSHLAARMNGFLFGFGSPEQLDELADLGVDEETVQLIRLEHDLRKNSTDKC